MLGWPTGGIQWLLRVYSKAIRRRGEHLHAGVAHRGYSVVTQGTQRQSVLITGGPQDRRTLLGRDSQVELREARLAALLHIRQVPDEGRNQGALKLPSGVLSGQSGVLYGQSGVLSAVHEEGE